MRKNIPSNTPIHTTEADVRIIDPEADKPPRFVDGCPSCKDLWHLTAEKQDGSTLICRCPLCGWRGELAG